MQLKKFLELIRTDETINLYNPIENRYLQKEEYKGNIDKKYFNCKVVGINTKYIYDGFFGNTILEIDIINT